MDLTQLEPIIVAALRHKGKHDPELTSSSWEDLILWASPKGFLGRDMEIRAVGLLWDDPRQFRGENRRYDVGIPIDAEDAIEVDEPAFLLVTAPGKYMKATHKGPYDDLLNTYEKALTVAMKLEGLELLASPIIELYRNSPAEVSAEELVTDIYFPVIKF